MVLLKTRHLPLYLIFMKFAITFPPKGKLGDEELNHCCLSVKVDQV